MRDRETRSLWSCFNGVAIDGPLQGRYLDRVPAFLCSFGEWLEEHPSSEVLAWDGHPTHEDPRHGHGSWFHFGGFGPHPNAPATMVEGGFDDRMPENTLVLGVCHAEGSTAFPLPEIQRRGGLIQTTLAGQPVVVWSRSPSSTWMAGFSRFLDGHVLEFERGEHGVLDRSTGTLWTVEGRAVHGPLAGRRLEALDFVSIKWHSWAGFHQETEIYRDDAPVSTIPPAGELEPLLEALTAAGFEVAIHSEVLSSNLPARALRGLEVGIGGDPFRVFRFDGTGAAADYAASRLNLPKDLYISFFPGAVPSDIERRATARGPFVVESNPAVQFADPESLERLPDAEIPWSTLLEDAAFAAALSKVEVTGDVVDAPAFAELFQALQGAGYEVRGVKPMLPGWLRPGATNGFSAQICGDRFLVYQFADGEGAAAYAAENRHSLKAGPFVLRSDPPDQYHVRSEQTYRRPHGEVHWSTLLNDPGFVAALDAVRNPGAVLAEVRA